jgi:hypothetical protein
MRSGNPSDHCLQSDFTPVFKPLSVGLSNRGRPDPLSAQTPFPRKKAMLNPSKSDCITILSAASELADDSLLPLDHGRLGLTRNGMLAAAAFLIERACFNCYEQGEGHYAVGALSLQGRLRLEQLAHG